MTKRTNKYIAQSKGIAPRDAAYQRSVSSRLTIYKTAKRLTCRQCGENVGVSAGTVSNIINGQHFQRQQTLAMVDVSLSLEGF